MAGESYNTTPQGKIVARGDPLIKTEMILTEAVYPGDLLEIAANDYKAELDNATPATNYPIGWAAFEHTDFNTRPDTYETAYTSGKVITVLAGGNFEIYARVSGQASTGSNVVVKRGDLLASNGDGTLKPFSTAVAVTQDETTPFAVTAAVLPGPAVAMAMESYTIAKSDDATIPIKRVHVRSLI